jgi:hypothetical protein
VQRATCTNAELDFLGHVARIAVGIALVDSLTGADLAWRVALRALNSGDPSIGAKSLTVISAYVAGFAPRSSEVARLCRVCEERARQLHEPELDSHILVLRTLRAYAETDWRLALDCSDRAVRFLREEGSTHVSELWTCRYFAIWSLFHLGDWSEMERRVRTGVEDARDRGQLFGLAGICSPFGVAAWLRHGDVDTARRTLAEVVSRWSVEGVQFQHFWFLTAETFIHLYEGDARTAWKLVESRWPDMANLVTMQFPVARMTVLYLRGCAALATAREHGAGAAMIRDARRSARRLGAVSLPPAGPLSEVLRAGIAARIGDVNGALRHGAAALAGLEVLEMRAHAAALARQLARLRGEALPEFFPGQEVSDPDAIARMLAPELVPHPGAHSVGSG